MSETSRQYGGTRYEVATEILRVLHADAVRRWQSTVGDESRRHLAEVDEYRALRNGLLRASSAEVEQLIAEYGPRARRVVTGG